MFKKTSFALVLSFIFFIGLAAFFVKIASAQVIVTPTQVPDNSRQTFTVNVPSSRSAHTTTALKLFLPQELTDVIPDVKPGWNVVLINKLTTSTTTPTEIDWTGGSIPTGEADTFQFSANVPSGSVTLVWRAYQKYSDGVLISWDQTPSATATTSTTTTKLFGPYSDTEVMSGSIADALANPSSFSNGSSPALDVGLIALVLSAMAVFVAWRSKLS